MVDVDKIDALLPQTQCRECGFQGCQPYAQALARAETTIDRCLPGGNDTIKQLAHLLEKDPNPYLQKKLAKGPQIAVIVAEDCIGCTKCIQACPIDAIIGAQGVLHEIIEIECTGCGLCIEPCPVDCITLAPITKLSYDKNKAKKRYQTKQKRQLQALAEKQQRLNKKTHITQEKQRKQNYILAALARNAAKKKGI